MRWFDRLAILFSGGKVYLILFFCITIKINRCCVISLAQYTYHAIYYVSSVVINVHSVQCLLTKGLFMNLLVVCHFGLLNRHLHRFLVIFFNSKLDVFHVLQPCQLCFSSLLLSYYLYWIQKYGLTSLNDRITCNFRIINQFT